MRNVGEAELEVEHEVRVAQAQRHLGELEVVEVGGAGELVRVLAVARLCRCDGLVDEAACLGDPCPHLGELVVRRGRERRRREGAGRDQRQQDDEAAHQP